MKRILILLSLLTCMLFMTTSVFAFSFKTPYNGPVKFKFSNWEQETPGTGNNNGIIDQQGEQLSGIFKVTSIIAIDAFNTVLWSDGDNGEELTGNFGGYIAGPLVSGGLGFDINFTGGWFDMYLDSSPDFLVTYPGTGATDGTLFLSAVGIGGIIPTSPNTTLHSSVTAASAPMTGHGSGYLNITGGSYASMMGTDTFGPGLDLLLESDFSAPGGFGWPITSEDPVTGNAVPEPATMLLLGSGLIGLAGFVRKKKFFKKD